MMSAKLPKWVSNASTYPIRFCKYGDVCNICEEKIWVAQKYYDGGYGRRAHILCAPKPTAATKGDS
jgi:hypothetical protein